MAKPKIDTVCAVWPNQLNSVLSNRGRDRIPVRVLSRTDWVIPVHDRSRSLQPHRAMPEARFPGLDARHDQGMHVRTGVLVCWAHGVQEYGEHWRAATGEEAVGRLRALARPNLRDLYGTRAALKEARMELDVVLDDILARAVAEES